MYKLTIYIPESHLETVKSALFTAGAGAYEAYDRCSWQVRGEGQFRALKGSRPAIGTEGVETHVTEYRVEMICPEEKLFAAREAIKKSHPYEVPAFDFTRIIT